MQVIINEDDQSYIDKINNDDSIPRFVHTGDNRYYIEFTVTDEGKANLLCQYLMRPHDFGKEFCETFGIHTECIRFSHPDGKKSEIIDMLKNFIYQLENIT